MSDSAGRDVLRRVLSLQVAPGAVALWWLGQSGYMIRAAGATLLVDPFLSERDDRLTPPAFRPEDAAGIDVIACTHDHIDHLDAPSIPGLAAASPGARFVVPAPIVPQVTALDIDPERVIGVQPGTPVQVAGVTLHPVRARHGDHMTDAYTFGEGNAVHYVGYVIEADGVHVYHAGDTIVYDGMVETLRELRVDVALLPINGRDYFREAQDLVGNMDPRDAAELASRIDADLLVPMHYDMFPHNLGYPDHLVQLVVQDHPKLSVMVPGLERPFLYTRPTD
jgi:L-ascorbate 6-phosphate lactonase